MHHAYLFRNLICTLVACSTYLACISANAFAQHAPITSSGLNTQVSGPISVGGHVQYDITGGTRPNGGPNLFHSFGEFGVPNNTIANFLNTPHVETTNILGRVTGGHISNIFGAIQTDGFGSANLFLMNPMGFLFGPNAAIHVGGMVSFTSADYLKFEDGKKFNAIPSAADALLSASPVAAFGFLGSNPGAIRVQGSHLEVRPEKGIALIGGSITIEPGTPSGGTAQRAKLSAPNGKIQLASTASPGEFDTTLQPGPNVNGTSFISFGSVTLAPASTVDVSGTNTVSIRGGQFVLSMNEATLNTAQSVGDSGTIVLSKQSTIVTEASGTELGGTITLTAEKSLTLRGNSSITTRVDSGNGGPVILTAPSIQLEEGSNIGTSTSGLGKAGNVELQGDQVNLTSRSIITTRTQALGNSGDITIRGLTGEGSRASDVRLSQNSRLVSETIGDGVKNQGNAGNIRVATARLNLSGASLFNTTSRGSTGDGGNISVDATDSVTISGSGTQLVSASAESSSGNAGNISITAPSIVVENGGSISSNTGLSGNAGTITVNTTNLQLLSGGQITSRSLLEFPEMPPSGTAGAITVKGLASPAQSILINGSRSGIFTDTAGSGPGGNINVNANSITLQNGGILSAKTSGTEASAIGGTITVNANHMQLHSGATITAKSNGVANAGNINVSAADGLTMQNGSSITTLVDQNAIGSTARGGNITVTTAPTATVNIQDSTISASVPGSGDGGNVTIDPYFVILQNGRILSQTDRGTGGNIHITARVFLPDATSVISADAARGVNGTVTIQSPYAPASGKIQPLGNRPLQAQSLLNQRCAALADGKFSSFTIAGRDGPPTELGGWLSSPLVLGTTESNGSRMTNIRLGTNLEELRGEHAPLWLREIAPPGFLTKTFAAPSPGGCAS